MEAAVFESVSSVYIKGKRKAKPSQDKKKEGEKGKERICSARQNTYNRNNLLLNDFGKRNKFEEETKISL